MKIKKVLSMIICVAMVLTFATQITNAYAEDTTPLRISVDSVSAVQGSSVTVNVVVQNAENLGGLDVSILYDSDALTVSHADKGSFVNGAVANINTNNAGIVKESIVAMDGLNGDGIIMSVCFNVSENAAIHDHILNIGIDEAFDTSFHDVEVERSPGKITVIQNDLIIRDVDFAMNVEPSDPVSVGEDVHLIVTASDPGDLSGGTFEFTYDQDILEYTEVSLGDELKSNTAIYSVNSNNPGLVRITYADIEAITANTDVEFFDIVFSVRSNNAAVTNVTFTGSSLLDANLNSMTTSGSAAVIYIEKKRSELYVDWDGSTASDRKFTVNVVLTGGNDVGAGDFWVNYDTSKLSCETVETDSSVGDSGAIIVTKPNISDGKVSFSYVNPSGCSTDSTLLNITFRQLHGITGSTEFTSGGKDVVDKDLNYLTLDYPAKVITMPYDEGHELSENAAIEPTCTEAGNTAYWTCTVCGKFFSDADGKTEIPVDSWVVSALGHDYVFHQPQEPTCTEAGWGEYLTCRRCDYTTYSEIPATGHDYVVLEPSWVKKDDGSYEVTAKAVCSHDASHVITETVTASCEVITEPTVDEEGLAIYTAVFENDIFDSVTKEEPIPVLTYGVPSYEWTETEGGYEVTATAVCADDPAKTITETVTAEYEVIVEPGCETEGLGRYTASFENGLFSTQIRDITLPAAGHAWGEPNWIWEEKNGEVTAKATFTCKNDSGHTLTIEAVITVKEGPEGDEYTAAVTGPDGEQYTATKVIRHDDILRIFGSGRYETAFKNANKLKEELGAEKFSTVVVATGGGFPDSLSGAYLANVKNAPILLINGAWAAEVRDYISANLIPGGNIYILGGEGVIKEEWLAGLGSFSVKRLAGSNRYETNLEILKEVGYNGGDILVATGGNYPDSLAASSLDMPILMVKGNELTEKQMSLLGGIGTEANVYIAGGTGAVSEAMEDSLAAYGSIVKRFAGSNRYITSRLIAEEFFADPGKAVLAVGNNFPDGLSAGPLAAEIGAPILLVNEGRSTEAKAYTDAHDINTGIVIGGTALISDETAKDVLNNDIIVLYE